MFDTNRNGVLDYFEFKKAVEDFQIQIHPKDIENLFKSFDHNHDGSLTYSEFLDTLIGTMNKLRYELVDKAWNKIDPGHYGEASLADMFSAFDGSRHPDCYTNKITPEDAQADF